MKKRVLWLLNHTALRKFEVPLLVEMGFEVFCPKIFQVGAGDGSASVTYEYDRTLTIPRDVLDELNQVDFYETIPAGTMRLVNQYFDIAFFHYFPNQFRTLIRSFRGVLVFQAFGLLFETPYTQFILKDLGLAVFQQVQGLGQRFFFAQAYPHLKDVECDYFRQRAIDMPLGLQSGKREKRWAGGDPRFLFVLPRINTSDYFWAIYHSFRKDFQGLDYMIGGAQPIAVTNDPKVTGFMPQEQYEYAMTHCAAMYYHSTEKNHIHYHPFEAVRAGMPLVFMGGGMMDRLGGKDLPGRCGTVKEARRKLEALSKGDTRLAQKIIQSQDVLLEHFSYENCRGKWETGLKKILEQTEAPIKVRTKKKIAVILPQPYLGGVLDYTIRMVKCLVKGAAMQGDEVSVVLGYPDDPVFQEKDRFRDIADLKVSTRAFQWVKKTADWTGRTYKLMNIPGRKAEACCVMDDGINCFEDCDYLIFTADRIPDKLFSSRPYIVVAHDYIQRYLPEVLELEDAYEYSYIEAARTAEAVFVTTPATGEDAVQYAGISPEKVMLTPLMFDMVSCPDPQSMKNFKVSVKGKYFLWSTNANRHKNHKKALLALEDYYDKGGKLYCVMTGVNTDAFNINAPNRKLKDRLAPYAEEVRKMIRETPALRSHIIVMGNMPKLQYLKVLQQAQFIFHPGYADNGNGTAIDAACLGVPTVCSDYPAMRYIDTYIGLHAHFFDPFDEASIRQALIEAEDKSAAYKKDVPSREALKRFTVEGSYQELYQAVQTVIGG